VISAFIETISVVVSARKPMMTRSVNPPTLGGADRAGWYSASATEGATSSQTTDPSTASARRQPNFESTPVPRTMVIFFDNRQLTAKSQGAR
jgi:hypothetical protein